MIHGIGVDTVGISRFKRAMDRWGSRLLERLFTPGELAYCMGKRCPERHLAARFAAKSSFVKALGAPVCYRHIEVVRGPSGAPSISAKAVEDGMNVVLTIAHDGDLSIAQTIIERAA